MAISSARSAKDRDAFSDLEVLAGFIGPSESPLCFGAVAPFVDPVQAVAPSGFFHTTACGREEPAPSTLSLHHRASPMYLCISCQLALPVPGRSSVTGARSRLRTSLPHSDGARERADVDAKMRFFQKPSVACRSGDAPDGGRGCSGPGAMNALPDRPGRLHRSSGRGFLMSSRLTIRPGAW